MSRRKVAKPGVKPDAGSPTVVRQSQKWSTRKTQMPWSQS